MHSHEVYSLCPILLGLDLVNYARGPLNPILHQGPLTQMKEAQICSHQEIDPDLSQSQGRATPRW